MILNLGCGNDTYGDVRVDLVKTESTTDVFDIGETLPRLSNRELGGEWAEKFDVVYEKNLLEHLPNPGEHLKAVYGVLKHGGRLELTTDNAACLKYYTLGTHTGGYHRSHNSPNAEDRHYALFTEEHLRNMLVWAGVWSSVKTTLVDTDYFTRHFDRVVRLFWPSLSWPRIRVVAVKE